LVNQRQRPKRNAPLIVRLVIQFGPTRGGST
jgi:hypothetical protein